MTIVIRIVYIPKGDRYKAHVTVDGEEYGLQLNESRSAAEVLGHVMLELSTVYHLERGVKLDITNEE